MGTQSDLGAGGCEEVLGGLEEGGEVVGVGEAVPGGAALRAEFDEAAFEQAGEVFGDGGLGEPEVIDQVAHAVLAVGEVVENGEACGVGQ